MKKKVVKLVKKSQLTSNSKRMQNAFPKLEEKLQTDTLQKSWMRNDKNIARSLMKWIRKVLASRNQKNYIITWITKVLESSKTLPLLQKYWHPEIGRITKSQTYLNRARLIHYYKSIGIQKSTELQNHMNYKSTGIKQDFFTTTKVSPSRNQKNYKNHMNLKCIGIEQDSSTTKILQVSRNQK